MWFSKMVVYFPFCVLCVSYLLSHLVHYPAIPHLYLLLCRRVHWRYPLHDLQRDGRSLFRRPSLPETQRRTVSVVQYALLLTV